MVQARPPKKIVRKRDKPFRRFVAHKFKRIQTTWRKPRGIDNPMRRGYRGHQPIVSIGYGNDKRTKYMDKNTGFKRFVVNNVKDLELLLMHNHEYAAVIAHNVGAKKRKDIIKRADELDIKVINRNAKLKATESE